jgi:hypothetical protein
MDLSKLPPSGQTPHVPAPNHDPAAPVVTHVPHYATPVPGAFIPAEFWLSLAIGIIVLFVFPTFRQYLVYHSHPEKFDAITTFTDKSGNVIAYEDSAFFYPGMGITVFGVVLILDALALLRSRFALLVGLAFILTVVAVALNIFAVIKAYDEIGFQLPNALAVAFSGYIALYDWRLLQSMRLR